MSETTQNVLLTGGAGYIGSVLTPKLLERGHRVTVFDGLFFGGEGLASCAGNPRFDLVEGDIRDHAAVARLLEQGDFDSVIHLAAISNDPCSELDEALTRSVNLEATGALMQAAKKRGVKRFLYASSASVYGLKGTEEVTEDMSLEPLTLYARYKAEGEEILDDLIDDTFTGVSVRSATVCGYSPRLRLDLTINILTHFALTEGKIRVFGGEQMRPNIHIDDLASLYCQLLGEPAEAISGQRFNVSRENSSVLGLAQLVASVIDPDLPIEIVDTPDHRSYCLSAAKLERQLGFTPQHTLEAAVEGLAEAYREGLVPDPTDSRYRNVEVMKRRRDQWLDWQSLDAPCPA